MTNALYYGDNLAVLRESIADESVDLIYLDPPFNSQASYNVLFQSPAGEKSEAQIEAFEDTWHWNDSAEFAFDDVMRSGNAEAAEMLRAIRSFLGENDMMAYLAMMAVRLIELHRTLRRTGSIYLHCDPTASHYLKILLDSIFGAHNFANEIIWRRYNRPKGSQHKARRYGRSTDTILFYLKSDDHVFNPDRIAVPLTEAEIAQRFTQIDDKGRWMSGPLLRSEGMGARPNLVYEFQGYTPGPAGWRMSRQKLQEVFDRGDFYFTTNGIPRRKFRPTDEPGTAVDNLWDDISALGAQDQERLGYPTQKPVVLLERIINASSNPGDVVLDPFCGCGTTIHAAQKLNRQWVGIDVTHLAISLIEKRLKDAFPEITYEVHGTPKDLAGAQALADYDKYQFQWWAVSLVNAVPYGGKKKGADSGIDGIVYFKPDARKTEKAIVSVKGGANVNVGMIRDLAHVVERENAKVGIFITLADPTGPMNTEAVKAGFYETEFGRFPKLQIFTIEQLFAGKRPQLPWLDQRAFKQAPREEADRQGKLALG